MARVLFDALSLDGRPSGTRTRLVRLVPELAKRGHDVTVAHGPELDDGARAAMHPAALVEISPAPGPGPARRLALQRLVYRRLQRQVSPEWVSAETWPMPRVPGLLPVVHDLRYLDLGKGFRALFDHFLRDACARAARIHTDSATVADQLAAHLGISPERIDVVPIGVPSPDASALAAATPPVEGRYVVVVGHDEPRKDFHLVGEVASALADHGITVVQAGRRPGERVSRGYRAGKVSNAASPKQHTADQPSPISHIGIVSDELRDVLYHHAVAVFVASRHEGYGLVPLEGLAAGAWVVASDIAAHREVLGDAATLFPLGDKDAAIDGILEAATAGAEARQARADRARARAARFSLSRSAEAFEASLARR